MKPLVSPVVEYRLMAVFEIVAGAGLTVAFAAADGVVVAATAVLTAATFFGVLMYLFVYRRTVREVLQHPVPSPTPARGKTAKTARRAGGVTAGLLVAAALGVLLDAGPFVVAGIALGNGGVLRLTSGRLERWEARSGRRLLREPRYRWDGRESPIHGTSTSRKCRRLARGRSRMWPPARHRRV